MSQFYELLYYALKNHNRNVLYVPYLIELYNGYQRAQNLHPNRLLSYLESYPYLEYFYANHNNASLQQLGYLLFPRIAIFKTPNRQSLYTINPYKFIMFLKQHISIMN